MHFGGRQPAKVIKGSVVKKESGWLEVGLVHRFNDTRFGSLLRKKEESLSWLMPLAGGNLFLTVDDHQ